MALPLQGIDAHGHRITLEPATATVPAVELQYVRTYAGLTYNTYVVQYLGEYWPEAKAAAIAIEHVSPWDAFWSTNPDASGCRILTVYTD